MSKIRKANPANEPSPKERLSASYLTAFEADFKLNGMQAIQRLRDEDPARYCDIAAKLIAAVEQPAPGPNALSNASSQADIARRLLADIGCANPDQTMIDMAVTAQLAF